jgi:indole-3-acetate monooxygenase
MVDATPAGTSPHAALLERIRGHRADFEAAAQPAEELRTLPAATVAILRELGLFWLKTPAEFGGTPLDPLPFCDVIEEVAYADTSTAWAAMIGAGCTGMMGGWLPDAGAKAVFGAGGPLPVGAGQPQPRGSGRRVKGGYSVTGRWGFASGIVHANWLIGAFAEDGGERRRLFVIPKDQAEVIDHWHVAGLQGTGSLDFRVEDLFVPEEMTFDPAAGPARGGGLFRQDLLVFVSNEVPPLCVGLARRAIDDMTAVAGQTARFPGAPTLSERAVFQKELGRAEIRVRAARLVHRDAIGSAWAAAQAGDGTDPGLASAAMVASVYAVETCAEVVSDLFRYGGGRVLALAHPMQRHLRNALAARQHLALSEELYEIAGRLRLQAADRPGDGARR